MSHFPHCWIFIIFNRLIKYTSQRLSDNCGRFFNDFGLKKIATTGLSCIYVIMLVNIWRICGSFIHFNEKFGVSVLSYLVLMIDVMHAWMVAKIWSIIMFAIIYKTISNINKVVIKDFCYFPFLVNNIIFFNENVICLLTF